MRSLGSFRVTNIIRPPAVSLQTEGETSLNSGHAAKASRLAKTADYKQDTIFCKSLKYKILIMRHIRAFT
jgi:hypothetical protein